MPTIKIPDGKGGWQKLPVMKGDKGDKGDPGDISRAEFDAQISSLTEQINKLKNAIIALGGTI